jgi:hypothetical protein
LPPNPAISLKTVEPGGTRHAIGYEPGDNGMAGVDVLTYECE